MEQLLRPLYRAALWAFVLVLLGSTLATVTAAPTPAATAFTLTGYVDQPGGGSAPPVPAGVTVELVSAASGATYKAVTGVGGVFTFTTSSTTNALGPGYWKLVVPSVANVSVSGCGKCAVLPTDQNPTFAYYSYGELTNKNFATTIGGVQILPYTATQNGTVHLAGLPTQGVKVDLLDPNYNGLVLSNTTTNASGEFTLKTPEGKWVLQSVKVSGNQTFTNSTQLTITVTKPPVVIPALNAFTISGWINSTLGRIPTSGNATLFDPTNGYIYSVATPPGGYYSLPTYLAGFSHGAQKFDVVLAANGYGTVWYAKTISSAGAVTRNVVAPTMPASSMGLYTTDLNFSGINTTTGKGSLSVVTDVRLGNDSVVPNLPNATLSQLWAQLGLDYNHTLSFPATDGAKVQAFLNSRGPFFLPAQSSTVINTTSFVAFTTPQSLASFTLGCATFCGMTSASALSYSWSQSYMLNGTLAKNAASYTLGFNFQHPASSSLVYNYSLTLPTGYVLSAGTAAPAHTTLTPTGPSGTWGKFTLTSNAWTTASSSAKFTLVKAATVQPVVNVTSTNFTFSSANVLNDSNGKQNYTVVLGTDENATFSAANSKYNGSTNGSLFVWNFGDGSPVVSTVNQTANHTYLVATPTTNFPSAGFYNGSLTITTSGGQTNSTHFHVWVVTSTPTAVITSNATAAEMKTAGGHPYLQISSNKSATLSFNANSSVTPKGNVLSIASFDLVATKLVHKSANFSVANGAKVGANYSVDFNPPKTLGTGKYITTDADIAGTLVPLTAGTYGWEYNLTLTVWSGTGTKSTATLPILLVDKQAPTSAFTVLNGAGKAISGSAITEGKNGTAKILLNAATSIDPNNGTIKSYLWNVTNGNNTTLAKPLKNVTSVKPYPVFYLAPETHPYTINLTVTDANGNRANKTFSLTVSPNATTRPVMYATTLTGPTSLTNGKSATFWVNVTNKGGTASKALNVSVSWYFQSSSGTGSKRYVPGSPGATEFFGYVSGTVNATASHTGLYPKLAWNKTVRAQITFTPSFTGNYVLYANATAQNEFVPDYHGGSSVAAISVTLHANPTTELLEYGGIAAAVIVAIGLLIWWTRRPSRKAGSGGKPMGRGGLERGSKKPESDDKDDEP